MRARFSLVFLLGSLAVGSSLVTVEAFSQPRHGGPAPGRPHGGVHSAVYVGGYWGSPFFGSYYWPWFSYPYWGWPPAWYYGTAYDPTSEVRIQVTPKQAEVFVNGYFAGTVDDFDGTFQRLRLMPGEHELVIYLDGYRAMRQRLLLAAGADMRVRHTMEPLAPGEVPEPRPQPAPPPPAAQPGPTGVSPQGAPPQGVPPAPDFPPMPPSPPAPSAPADPRRPPVPGVPSGPPQPPGAPMPPVTIAQGFGTLSVRVQPAGAEVLVDGERWVGPEGFDRLELQLGEGIHRVEVRKEGYRPYSADVQIRRGERTSLNVSLPTVTGNR